MEAIYEYLSIPFGYLLGWLYSIVDQIFGAGSYFISIALFALIFKIVLLPSAIKQQKSTAKQARLQPKIRRIQERYKGDKNAQQKIQEEQQALYQREGFNPMNQGCAPLLIQFPIIIGLYGAVYRPLTYILKFDRDTVIEGLKKGLETLCNAKVLLGENGKPITFSKNQAEIQIIRHIDEIKEHLIETGSKIGDLDEIAEGLHEFADTQLNFFGLDLTQNPELKFNWLLLIPVLSFLTSMATSLIAQKRQKNNNPAASNKLMSGCTSFGMPLFSAYMTTLFPAAVGVYWIINNIYSFIQTLIIGHFYSADKVIAETMVEETIYRRSKEKNMKILAEQKDKK